METMSRYLYVYVLRSQVDDQFYVGFTRDLRQRFAEHQSGGVPSTRARRPFDLIYYEACLCLPDAIQRERYLKSAWGKRYLKTRLRGYLTG